MVERGRPIRAVVCAIRPRATTLARPFRLSRGLHCRSARWSQRRGGWI